MIFRHITKYTQPIKSINVNKYLTPIYYADKNKEPIYTPNNSILDKNFSEYFWEQQNMVTFNNNNKNTNTLNLLKTNKQDK